MAGWGGDVDARELLDRLIGFDTTSDKSNLPLIDFVQGWLEDQGVASVRVPDASGLKANLIATIGPPDQPGLVLSGHTDVVPVQGQAWSSDPFRCVERDGRLYGRGTADMKGFLAAVLSRVPAWRNSRLEAPVHLAFSYDEEVGCRGVPGLIDRLLADLPAAPFGALIGEPTGMRPVDGHKGKAGYRVHVTGRAGHSALTGQGVNAIQVAALIIAELVRIHRRCRTQGPFADGFEPPHCTLNVGTIDGGTAMNIIPGEACFTFEIRTLPEIDPGELLAELSAFVEDELLPGMWAVAPEASVVVEELMSYPGLAPRGGQLSEIVMELTGSPAGGKAAFGTEAGHFQARGIEAIVCGPGDIRVAHKPDEHLEIEQLGRCTSFLDQLVERVARAR